MNRIDALREVSLFMRHYKTTFAALPRDTDGRPANIEIRKLLAVDADLAIALAALLAFIYAAIEHEAIPVAANAFEGNNR